MMAFKIVYHDQVKKDISKLKLSKPLLDKLKLKIEAVASNPFPKSQGGLGEPLAGNLSGFLKFRFNDDYRVVYQIVEQDNIMTIIVIGLRADKSVYQIASKRK